MSLRREHYNMTAMLEDGTRTKKPKNLTIHPPKRLMPTEIGTGVLGGNQIINSWAAPTIEASHGPFGGICA